MKIKRCRGPGNQRDGKRHRKTTDITFKDGTSPLGVALSGATPLPPPLNYLFICRGQFFCSLPRIQFSAFRPGLGRGGPLRHQSTTYTQAHWPYLFVSVVALRGRGCFRFDRTRVLPVLPVLPFFGVEMNVSPRLRRAFFALGRAAWIVFSRSLRARAGSSFFSAPLHQPTGKSERGHAHTGIGARRAGRRALSFPLL